MRNIYSTNKDDYVAEEQGCNPENIQINHDGRYSRESQISFAVRWALIQPSSKRKTISALYWIDPLYLRVIIKMTHACIDELADLSLQTKNGFVVQNGISSSIGLP